MINAPKVLEILQAETPFLPENLLVILGPTASGKTRLAVDCAKLLDGEVISADSRQVYRQMNLGTGKDIEEYGSIAYHLIDIVDPGEKYNISRFIDDFARVYQDIIRRGKKPIVCGGTGFYLQALLDPKPYTQTPVHEALRKQLDNMDKTEIRSLLDQCTLPPDFNVDYSSRKRMIRAIEIARWHEQNPTQQLPLPSRYSAQVIGLHPDLNTRRQRITKRLLERLEKGMIEEVRTLLSSDLTHLDLEYYGLEYKYISYYLQGIWSYEDLVRKLETEIHRYAKRQMTYFRKMEKDGITIRWLS